jgi:hypothetical protein
VGEVGEAGRAEDQRQADGAHRDDQSEPHSVGETLRDLLESTLLGAIALTGEEVQGLVVRDERVAENLDLCLTTQRRPVGQGVGVEGDRDVDLVRETDEGDAVLTCRQTADLDTVGAGDGDRHPGDRSLALGGFVLHVGADRRTVTRGLSGKSFDARRGTR